MGIIDDHDGKIHIAREADLSSDGNGEPADQRDPPLVLSEVSRHSPQGDK